MKDEKNDLNGLNNDMGKTGGLLGYTMNRLNILATTPAGHMTCYIVLFVLVFLLVLYIISWKYIYIISISIFYKK